MYVPMSEVSPAGSSQCINCRSVFGGDEVLRYSFYEMREKMNMTVDRSIFTDNPTSELRKEKHTNFSAVECDENVALRAAIPIIPDMARSDSSDNSKFSHKLCTAHLLMLNQKHN